VRFAWASMAVHWDLGPLVGPPAGLQLLDLPADVLQAVADWLPTFHGRVRLRRAARALAQLDWRWGPPRQLEEELARMGLGDRGAEAVALALPSPLSRGLGELSLAENRIGDAGAVAIARALKAGAGIRRLSLRDNLIGDAGARALAEALSRNITMEEIDLWGNRMSDVGKAVLLGSARCDVFLEVDPPCPGGASFGGVNPKMRAILFEWIAQVHSGMQMPPAAAEGAPDPQEMLFRTYRHVDAYITHCAVQRNELQLVGVACTLLASGYGVDETTEDDLELKSWLHMVTDGMCSIQEVRSMVGQLQGALGFRLHQPTVYTFLRRYLRRTGWTEDSFSLANYLVELAALDATFLTFRPQAIAAAAAVLSRQYVAQGVSVKQTLSWKAKLLACAQVEVRTELAGCMATMAMLHRSRQGDQSNFVNRKYAWDTLHSVAKIPPNMPLDASYYEEYMAS